MAADFEIFEVLTVAKLAVAICAAIALIYLILVLRVLYEILKGFQAGAHVVSEKMRQILEVEKRENNTILNAALIVSGVILRAFTRRKRK